MLVPGGTEYAGGIGRWAGYLAQAWRDQALSPPLDIIDTRDHGHAGRAAGAFIGALLRLARLHAAGQLGLIHANLSTRGSTVRKLLVARFCRLLGVPLIIHLHGSGYDAFYAHLPAVFQRQVRSLFLGADGVLVLGQFWADWVIGVLGVEATRVHVLYNGVPRPGEPRRRRETCHIVLLGRIGPRKGVPELLEALASEKMRGLAWCATLAGDGDIASYREMAAARGLSARVALPGWLDGPAARALTASADILVLPSHAENFPISVIEALAAGVAVVATPVGATPELLVHERSAMFVPVGDAGQLAAALARLIEDPALRERLAAAGHEVFCNQLDIETLARRLAVIHAATMRPVRAPC